MTRRLSASSQRGAEGASKKRTHTAAHTLGECARACARSGSADLHAPLLDWYARQKRDLPWRGAPSPYEVLVSETMLQQTRVETVIPYYERFLSALPTLADLAEAPEEQVLSLWNGLGYYRRARFLHAAAKEVIREHGGQLPKEPESLRRLTGIGAYTAGAVASIAFGSRAAVVDGNVARVLSRLFALEEDIKSTRGSVALWRIAEDLLPAPGTHPGDWNQALMELGATLCTPRQPLCGECPVRSTCAARASGRTSEFPHTTLRKKPTVALRVAMVFASKKAVLLARRRPGALFGGLWEPPMASGEPADVLTGLGLSASYASERVGEVRHVLSHRLMKVEVRRARLPKLRRWAIPSPEYDTVAVIQLDAVAALPHSALTSKVLVVANVPACDLPSIR